MRALITASTLLFVLAQAACSSDITSRGDLPAGAIGAGDLASDTTSTSDAADMDGRPVGDPGGATATDHGDGDLGEGSGQTGRDAGGAGVDVGSLEPGCTEDAHCDDGLACTADHCDAVANTCSWTLEPERCLIAGRCRAPGEQHPGDACRACDPDLDTRGWSPAAEGDPCDDGDPCTVETTCVEGACAGSEVDCDDENPCTLDACVPGDGCHHPPAPAGVICGDEEAPCVGSARCLGGECRVLPTDCDDDNPCTADACDEEAGGCVNTPEEGACDDGDACTVEDFCEAGACAAGEARNCADGSICTKDLCDAMTGCYWLPMVSDCCRPDGSSVCDDGNPCTDDPCDEAGGCAYVPNTALCDDGDACTEEDTCAEGSCAGSAIVCDDDNECTADSCDPETGCVFEDRDGVPCDDGVECTTLDHCEAGVCTGDDSDCGCVPDLAGDAAKISYVQVGQGGYQGEALDLDDDPDTCAPPGDCADGAHNGLTIIAGFVNETLQASVEGDEIILVLEIEHGDAGDVVVAVHTGAHDPDHGPCDPQAGPCAYLVDRSTLDPDTCEALAALPGRIEDGKLEAGGPGSQLVFRVPLSADAMLEVELSHLQLEATVELEGGEVTSLAGVLGGAVTKEALLLAVDQLPADGTLPVDPGLIRTVVTMLPPDIDTDGDGDNDALSIGLKIEAVDAVLTGAF